MQAEKSSKESPLVLIVDDESFSRLVIKYALEKEGYRTIEAADGFAAVKSFQDLLPDIILLDMLMPGIDGLETCRRIRNLPGGKYLPLLMVTGMERPTAVHEAFEAGTTDFISKPVNPELLVYRVDYMIRASQSIRKLAISEEQLAHAQQIATLGNWELDAESGSFNGSREALRILGLPWDGTSTFTDFIGKFVPEDREALSTRLRNSHASNGSCAGEFSLLGDTGLRIVRLQWEGRRLESQPVQLLVGTIQDITDIRSSENRLQMLKVAIDSLPIGITITDTEGDIIYANPAEANIHGCSIDELMGRKAAEFAPIHLRKPRLPELIDHNDVWRRESVNVRSTGEEFPVQLSSIAVRDPEGRCLGMVTACEDITPWKEAEQRINQLACFDTLTGLANRRTFFDRLTHAMSMAHRDERLVALLFFDLDNFKDINDTMGHDFGDRLLMEVAGRLSEIMRESDTLARLGGDEFVIVLTSITSLDNAAIVAQRILSILSSPFSIDDQQVFTSTSIGISLFPIDGKDPENLFKCADTAMYSAKEMGKATFRFFSSEMNLNVMRRVALESGMRKGIDNNEFFMHYQPQWNLRTNRVIGVEALIRWQSPEFGLLMPSEFIGMSEVTGLILPLGEWALRSVCQQSGKWQHSSCAGLRVAVNISGRQLTQPNFLENAREIILQSGVNPGSIEFEFTESVLMDNADKAIGTLRELKKIGIQMSIDDFGTGYSSLSYLKHFPIDRIKIDRSFVTDITVNSDDAAIVAAIISMSHSLNLKVIAEGVENQEQMKFLKDHNCDEVQGYYLARPMSPENLEWKLAELKYQLS